VIVLEVNNSYSRITGLTDAQHKELKDLLSYEIDSQQAYFSGTYKNKRTLFGKRGDFPTGLLYLVRGWLKKQKCLPSVKDLRKRPAAIIGGFDASLPVTPYPEQIEASEACLRHHRGIVAAPTGVGKSLITALIISKLKVRTLIVVPTLELKRQLTESLSSIFPRHKVGEFGKDIAVENIDALDVNKPANYDAVIIDEFHHSAAKTYRLLNKKSWVNVYYRIGLTATPFRSNDNEKLLLESILAEVIYKIDYTTAVARSYIVPLEAYYIEVPKTEVEGYTWSEVYSELVVNNEPRNKIIKNLIQTLDGHHVLTLVKEIEHGEWLSTISKTLFANGQDKTSREYINRFSTGGIKSLIGTTGILGEGVDTKPAEWVIIAGLGKSKNAFMQQVGRAFRMYPGKESAKIIFFKDTSHKWTINHFNAQCKILREEYGVKPVKLEVV